MRSHVESILDKKKTFKCVLCQEFFSLKQTLNQHVIVIHEKDKTIKCEICDATFSHRNYLRKHTGVSECIRMHGLVQTKFSANHIIKVVRDNRT